MGERVKDYYSPGYLFRIPRCYSVTVSSVFDLLTMKLFPSESGHLQLLPRISFVVICAGLPGKKGHQSSATKFQLQSGKLRVFKYLIIVFSARLRNCYGQHQICCISY